MQPLEGATLSAVQATFLMAQAKHPGHTLNLPDLQWYEKLAAVAEEFGEVSQLFTYDKRQRPDPDIWKTKVIGELIQLATLCLAWVESLDHGGQ